MATKLNDIEVAFRLKGEQGLKALDGIVEKSERAQKSFDGFAKSARNLGLGFAAVGAAITASLGLAVRGAEEEAEALRQLEGTINATGDSFANNRGRIDTFIAGLTKATKFTDDEIIPALNRAVIATGNLDDGFRAAELGVKLAAAGFGSLEGNAALVARLLEGQVGAIGRVIPEFRDLEERLEAGATEADLAAEALTRLQNIAENLKPPSGIQQFNNAIGELRDAIGFAVIDGLAPLVLGLTEAVKAFTAFAQTGPGKVVIVLTALAGILATVSGALIFFIAQVVLAGPALKKFTADVTLASFSLAKFATALAGAAVLGGLAALAVFVGNAAVELNKLSKALDDARDKAFGTKGANRIAQFNAEMNALHGTMVQLEKGTISAAEAQEVFNRFGVESLEQARQRVFQLGAIVVSLQKEKEAQEEAAKADAARLKEAAEAKRIAEIIKGLEEEKQKRIELDILQEKFAERELERGRKLIEQAGLTPAPIAPPAAPGPLDELDQLNTPGEALAGGISSLLEPIKPFKENAQALKELDQAAVELAQKFEDVAEAERIAAEQGLAFEEQLSGFITTAIDGLAQLASNFAVDMIDSFDQAGKNAQRFFASLGKFLVGAIAKALILQSIIGAFGGGTGFFSKAINRLGFQDPVADQLARFEGQRFVDLFFQGVTREMGNAQDRMDASITENRNLVETRGKPTSIIVTEASPETTVEFTDRKVEPRVRARARQRTGNVDTPFGSTA